MAGSAKVTPMPSSRVINKTSGKGDRRGRPLPMTSPKGIRLRARPSRKNIRPTMTANSPPVMIHASCTT